MGYLKLDRDGISLEVLRVEKDTIDESLGTVLVNECAYVRIL